MPLSKLMLEGEKDKATPSFSSLYLDPIKVIERFNRRLGEQVLVGKTVLVLGHIVELAEPFAKKSSDRLIDMPIIAQKLAPQAACYEMWPICPRRLPILGGKESRILLAIVEPGTSLH